MDLYNLYKLLFGDSQARKICNYLDDYGDVFVNLKTGKIVDIKDRSKII